MKIILASASPRRKEILSLLNIPFEIVVSDADETIDASLPAYFTAETLSLKKATAVAKTLDTPSIVIAADTIVVKDDIILTKPKDDKDAYNMLKTLSGNWHSVITGVTVMNSANGESKSFYVETKVHFIEMTDDEIYAYIKTGECSDKAGSYAIQGIGGAFIDKIDGDYFNVVGLPLCRLRQVLKKDFSVL